MDNSPRLYRFGSIEFVPSQQELRSRGQSTTLTLSLTRLLLLFVSRPGQLITREQIAAALWEDHRVADTTSRINTSIRRLREQLAETGDSAEWIETVVGSGYRLKGVVEEVRDPLSVSSPQPTEESFTALPDPAEPVHRARSGLRFRIALIGGSALVLVALVAALLHHYRGPGTAVSARTLNPAFIAHIFPVTYNDIDEIITAQSISPNGNFVAWSDPFGVTLETIDGRTHSQLVSPAGLKVDRIAWFPDGRRILLSGGESSSRSQAWVVHVDGEAPGLLLDDAELAMPAPDGRHIAFLRAAQTEVWIADADGQNTRKLLSGGQGDIFTTVLWSPDSARLVLDRQTTVPMPVSETSDGDQKGGPVEQLQVQRHWTYESHNAATGALLAKKDGLRFDSAVVLGDGRVVFPVNGQDEKSRFAVVWTDPSTGAVIFPQSFPQVEAPWGIDNTSAVMALSASADGSRISEIVERSTATVYLAGLHYNPSDRSTVLDHVVRLTRHTATSYPTTWSPSDTEILFDNGDSGHSVVAAVDIAGGPVRGLTAGERDALGQFSPDGKWILFLHFLGDTEHLQSIDRIPAGGGQPVPLAVPGEVEEFRCSDYSGGACVVRETVGKSELVYYALDPVRGRGAELARTSWEPNVLGDWSLSPDGATVAMADHDPANPGIQLIPLAPRAVGDPDTKVTKIPLTGFGIVLDSVWRADGKGFFVETHDAAGYALLSVDAQHSRTNLLRQSPELIWAVPSRDGKKLAFPLHVLDRNIWVGLTHAGTVG